MPTEAAMSSAQLSPSLPPSTSAADASALANQPGHKRTYQACLPCRDRKVRCDLGPVDNPGPPPCARCKRESKECIFSKTRRKHKPKDEDEASDNDAPPSRPDTGHDRKRLRLDSNADLSEAQVAGFRSQARLHLSPVSAHPPNGAAAYAALQLPRTPGGSIARYTPLQRPAGPQRSQPGVNEDEEQFLPIATVQALQRNELHGGHDALNLLSVAASEARVEGLVHRRTNSMNSIQRPLSHQSNTPGSQAFSSPQSAGVGYSYNMRPIPDAAVDPAIAQAHEESAYEDALKAWSRFRFVRSGWFSPKEALDYIQYFYDYLSPLTPICVPDFSDYSKHAKFISDEPMLVVTILTVASRYMKLSGPGASSRPYAIHERLWHYLQGMIERMIWGQEHFGGARSNAHGQPGADVNPLLRKGLRTLGTVESLMLLTEWHPRALHFPPGDDDDELVASEDPSTTSEPRNAAGGEQVNSWLEPCWRSDRMCWMLLGNALTLAFEIGVFDEGLEATLDQEFKNQSEVDVQLYIRRRKILRDLLLIYVTQTSGRLGLTSMLPGNRGDPAVGDRSDPRLQNRLQMLRESNRALLNSIKNETPATRNLIDSQDKVLYFWKEMAYFFEKGNLELFPNRRFTRDLITTGKYRDLLQSFNPMLQEWKENFDKTNVNQHMRYILLIEYEYSRVYVNTLALQAVVERCTNNTPPQFQGPSAEGKSGLNQPISSKTLLQWYGDDQQYIREIVDGCRHTLQIVVEGLSPGDFLKHAPVRTYFRIISVAILLLKTFALGAMEGDVAYSLSLLDQAVKVLRHRIVDDVHIANNFADLCDKLTKGIRSRFVRLAGSGNAANSNGVSRAGSPGPSTTVPTSPVASRATMGPPMNSNSQYQQSNWAGPGSNLNNYGSGNNMSNSPYHPLNGIRTETYDPNRDNGIIMPPPSSWFMPMDGANSTASSAGSDYGMSGATAGQNAMGGGGNSMDGSGEDGPLPGQDWLALPLDPLINSYGDVNQTIYGPDVGGVDMLDLLLSGMDGGQGGN